MQKKIFSYRTAPQEGKAKQAGEFEALDSLLANKPLEVNIEAVHLPASFANLETTAVAAV